MFQRAALSVDTRRRPEHNSNNGATFRALSQARAAQTKRMRAGRQRNELMLAMAKQWKLEAAQEVRSPWHGRPLDWALVSRGAALEELAEREIKWHKAGGIFKKLDFKVSRKRGRDIVV